MKAFITFSNLVLSVTILNHRNIPVLNSTGYWKSDYIYDSHITTLKGNSTGIINYTIWPISIFYDDSKIALKLN